MHYHSISDFLVILYKHIPLPPGSKVNTYLTKKILHTRVHASCPGIFWTVNWWSKECICVCS